MNNVLISLLLCVFGIFLLLVCLCVVLIVYRIHEVRKEKLIEAYLTKRQQEWFAYLVEGQLSAKQLQPKSKIEKDAIDKLFFHYRVNFSSETISYGMKLFAMHYLEDYYKRQLNSRSKSIRMNVYYKIYLFEWKFLLADVVDKLTSKQEYSKEEYLMMYRIIAKFDSEHFIRYYLNPKVHLGEFDYRKLLFELDEEQLLVLANLFEDLPQTLQWILVEIVGVKFYVNWLPFLNNCLGSEDSELRIRALKSIASLERIENVSAYEVFATSPIWEERLMVAKVFGVAPPDLAEPVLQKLMIDPSYQVRLQAAHSLTKLKTSHQAFTTIIQTSLDESAVALAEEMLEKE